MLKINVVLVNGRLIGRTVSDRWNLETIGYGMGDDRNRFSQASARRLASNLGCSIVVHRADQTIASRASKSELAALGRKLARVLSLVA
jgi:hypothetical protein